LHAKSACQASGEFFGISAAHGWYNPAKGLAQSAQSEEIDLGLVARDKNPRRGASLRMRSRYGD
jgi:hypothetical protein